MTAQSANRFVCEFCGNTLFIEPPKAPTVEPKAPTVENAPRQETVREREIIYVREGIDKSEEKLGCGLGGICFLVPIVGLILYFVYKSNGETRKSKSAITVAAISFGISLVWVFSTFWISIFLR